MYQTLYRKYRPRAFADVCGQARITTVLRRQVSEGTLTHAYLFCGTRGTGKTTCAKILAKVSNCLNPHDGEPCNECDNCIAADRGELLDILEVDAASNTGVENIRRLCEELNFLPSQGRKRVYIIDEVHMLSIGAFNALLKTLEEPPAHALFILATTELHKVPATVRSRCQCFTFHRISVEDITNRVMHVAAVEGIALDDSGARLIARLADGAMRDALSLLELCVGHSGPLDEETLDRLFGLGDGESIKNLVLSALCGDSVRALNLLDELYQSMGDLKEILSQVLGALRDMLLYRVGAQFDTISNRTSAQQGELSQAAKKYSEATLLFAVAAIEEALMRFDRLTVNKKTICEMAFLRICCPVVSADATAFEARIAALEDKIETGFSVEKPVKSSKSVNQQSEDADSVPWSVSSEELKPTESVARSISSVQKGSDRQTATHIAKNSDSNCSYAVELLKKLGSSDPIFASFYSNLQLEEEGTVLALYGEAFTIAMLQSREKEVLDMAREFASHITAVRFVEGKPIGKRSSADLGGF